MTVIMAGTEITRDLEEMMTGCSSATIETIGKELEIVITDGIGRKNMVRRWDNVVRQLLHLEHQDHAICANCLAQLKNAMYSINCY
jgi:hypothetical protein